MHPKWSYFTFQEWPVTSTEDNSSKQPPKCIRSLLSQYQETYPRARHRRNGRPFDLFAWRFQDKVQSFTN